MNTILSSSLQNSWISGSTLAFCSMIFKVSLNRSFIHPRPVHLEFFSSNSYVYFLMLNRLEVVLDLIWLQYLRNKIIYELRKTSEPINRAKKFFLSESFHHFNQNLNSNLLRCFSFADTKVCHSYREISIFNFSIFKLGFQPKSAHIHSNISHTHTPHKHLDFQITFWTRNNVTRLFYHIK